MFSHPFSAVHVWGWLTFYRQNYGFIKIITLTWSSATPQSWHSSWQKPTCVILYCTLAFLLSQPYHAAQYQATNANKINFPPLSLKLQWGRWLRPPSEANGPDRNEAKSMNREYRSQINHRTVPPKCRDMDLWSAPNWTSEVDVHLGPPKRMSPTGLQWIATPNWTFTLDLRNRCHQLDRKWMQKQTEAEEQMSPTRSQVDAETNRSGRVVAKEHKDKSQ